MVIRIGSNVYFLFAKSVIMCYNKLRKVIRSIKC